MSDEILIFIKEKVEKIAEDVNELKTNQAVIQLDVQHHVKRSDMLEDLVQHLDEKRIQPVEKELAELKGARKGVYRFMGLLIALGGMIAAFLLLRH